MERAWAPRFRLSRAMVLLQITFAILVFFLAAASLHRFYSVGIFFHMDDGDDICRRFHASRVGYADFDLRALSDRVDEVLTQMAALQEKLETTVQRIDKDKTLRAQNMSSAEFRRFLDEEVIQPLYSAHVGLRLIRLPRVGASSSQQPLPVEDPLINYFTVEETRKYLTAKENRPGKLSIHGANRTYNTIGHACVLMKKELEEYMNYDVGSYCKDDWLLGQQLMVGGCDPLPRRRCLARAPRLYQRPYAINESLWRLPDDRNVRWNSYGCRNFACLSSKNPKRGFSKCTGCFELDKEEKLKWVQASLQRADFLIPEVLAVKPGEIRVGLDVSVGTGTFAARMREWNVTVVSTALNVGAPFAETIALRGLVPLYATIHQRLPFFDNTMDLIHTTVFLDGWIDLQLMDFVLFDWDRVLRPGGLLWIDKFFCNRKDLDDYMYMFLQFRYRKHKWIISPKSKDEVYLSALLEKPPRSL